jgi:AcrR family transcriptional regulator
MGGPGPRERLLEAARELTYTEGVNVGVDAILRRAEVARRSLYQHFGGKDGLVAGVLRESAERDERRYREFLDQGGNDPRQRVMALFAALDEVTSAPGFRGCRFSTAELSLVDPGHPAHTEARNHKAAVHRLLQDELCRIGHPDPPTGADQLQLLIEGILVMAVLRPGTRPARQAATMAQHILDQAPA